MEQRRCLLLSLFRQWVSATGLILFTPGFLLLQTSSLSNLTQSTTLDLFLLSNLTRIFSYNTQSPTTLHIPFLSRCFINMPTHKVVKRKMTKRKLVNEILSLRSRVHSFAQWKGSMKNLTAMVQGEEYELPTMAISELDIGDISINQSKFN